jgi:hypothetical protein
MWRPSDDVDGECNARLFLDADHKGTTCTVRCRLELGHEGDHTEAFERAFGRVRDPVAIIWARDERREGSGTEGVRRPGNEE